MEQRINEVNPTNDDNILVQKVMSETAPVNLTFEKMQTPSKPSRLSKERDIEQLQSSTMKKPITMQVNVGAFHSSKVVRQLKYSDRSVSNTRSSGLKPNHRPSTSTVIKEERRAITPMSRGLGQRDISGIKQSMNSSQSREGSTMRKSNSFMYLSVRKNSQSKRSIISQLHPKEQKMSIDYFLGTAKIQRMNLKAQFRETIKNILALIQQQIPNGLEIVSNLKVIFFEHSQFIEGGTMGSSIQPINQNMMTLYLFHQFLKRYSLVYDHRTSHNYEMLFLEVSNHKMKKIDFNQFGTVLAKIAIKLYTGNDSCPEDHEPIELTVRLIHDYLFSVNITEKDEALEQDNIQEDQQPRDGSPSWSRKSKIEQVENEFDRCRSEYETTQAKTMLFKEKKLLEQIFNGYTKASKRGVKIIALRQFKWMMRDLSIIPHITTEYKCAQLFKYLDSAKKTNKDYPEEICTFDVFPMSIYIVFSLILEDETDLKQKAQFIVKWLKEHSKDKLAGVHANREDRRIQFTNQRLAGAKRA